MAISQNRLVWRRVLWVVAVSVAVVVLAEWWLVARVSTTEGLVHGANPTADASHLQTVLSHHPDALELTSGPAFQAWLHQDPARVQVLERGVAAETVDLLTAYKTSAAKNPPGANNR